MGFLTQDELNEKLNKKINDSDTNSKLSKQQIGVMGSLKTNKKDTIVNAINELYQSIVDVKNIATKALTDNGISYGDTDGITTLVQTMADNIGGYVDLTGIFNTGNIDYVDSFSNKEVSSGGLYNMTSNIPFNQIKYLSLCEGRVFYLKNFGFILNIRLYGADNSNIEGVYYFRTIEEIIEHDHLKYAIGLNGDKIWIYNYYFYPGSSGTVVI